MKEKFFKFFSALNLVAILSFSSVCFADTGDFGQVVNNILNPVSGFTDAFYKICYVLGGMLIVGSGIQYNLYRKNPVQVRLSNVFFLLIVGLVVVCLPFIVQLSSSSKIIDRSLHRQQSQVVVPTTPAPKQPVVPADNDQWYNSP